MEPTTTAFVLWTAIVMLFNSSIDGGHFYAIANNNAFKTHEACKNDIIRFVYGDLDKLLDSMYFGYALASVDCHEWNFELENNSRND